MSSSKFDRRFKTINSITNLGLYEKGKLFSDPAFREFCKKKFFSTDFIEKGSYTINCMAEITHFYCINSHYGLYHNLKNVALIKKLQHSGFGFDTNFMLDLIPEKLFISIKTLDELMKELPHLQNAIFSRCISFYLDFIILENKEKWLDVLLHIWNKNCFIQDKFPINTLTKALKFQRLVNAMKVYKKDIDKDTVEKMIINFEKRRRENLILILATKTKMNFEIKLIFEFLF
jgi:hypothetical protein